MCFRSSSHCKGREGGLHSFLICLTRPSATKGCQQPLGILCWDSAELSCNVTSWPLEDFILFKQRKTCSGPFCTGGRLLICPSLIHQRPYMWILHELYSIRGYLGQIAVQCRIAKAFTSSLHVMR